jgi:hypothetical protein
VRSDPQLQQLYSELFPLEIKDWLRAIETRATPFVPGTEAARSVALIEACYKQRRLLELPWVRPDGHRPEILTSNQKTKNFIN